MPAVTALSANAPWAEALCGRDRVRGSVGEYVQLLSCGRASMAAVGCGRKFGSEAMPRACGRPARQRGFGLRDGHGAEGAAGRCNQFVFRVDLGEYY